MGVEDEIRLEVAGGRAYVWLNRPQKRNALTIECYERIARLCRQFAVDRSLRVVVFRGVGGAAFCAGTDIGEFVAFEGAQDGVGYEQGVGEVLTAIANLPQVTVAAVEGACTGGGLAIATHCDVRVAATNARFGYPIARTLGNALSARVLYRCVAVFGESLTRQMLLLSELIPAGRAEACGAVARCVEPAGLDEAVRALSEGVCAASTGTVRATKEQLQHLISQIEQAPADDRQRVGGVYSGADFKEGVRAFLANQAPRFGGAGQ